MKYLVLLLFSLSAFGRGFNTSDIPFMSQGGTDWARRVVANGAAMPSANDIAAMERARVKIINAGLTNKIYAFCNFVTSSVIAASTPLFKHMGSDPWTNFNFVAEDLNIHGLKGDASTKYLDTGVKANATGIAISGTGSRGLTVLVSETSSNNTATFIGYQDPVGSPLVSLSVGADGDLEWLPISTSVTIFNETNDIGRVGWISGNVVVDGGLTNINTYVATPLEAHKLLQTKAIQSGIGVGIVNTVTDNTIPIFVSRHGVTNRTFNAQRLAIACLHDGFTQTESSNFWWICKTLREETGGGTGDPVHNYNNKVLVAGGAAISSTSSNNLRVFDSRLETFSLRHKIIAANTYRPDNLVAAQIPFIWKAGNEIWTNVNFISGDLTVNGLTGNTTTKYLGTGLKPNLLNYGSFSDTSSGVSLLIYSASLNNGSLMEYGANGSGANTFFGIQSFRGNLAFYCWGVSLVNQNFVTRNTSPLTTNFSGYLSGNRTAASAIRLDLATNGIAGTHEVFTNATGAQSLNNDTITNTFAHASAALGGTPGNWSDRTVSFLAIHSGLTQTESSNLWWSVRELRQADGGGYP